MASVDSAGWLERQFRLTENRTNVRTELLAGVTTFLTMSYIIFVQPDVLSKAGMDKDAVFVATCIASALATLVMAFLANYPVALAPAMGHNFFFAFAATPMIAKLGYPDAPWRAALGAVFICGVLFLVLSQWGFREKLMTAIPPSLQYSIAAGIGLLIAMVGMQDAGIIVAHRATLVQLGQLNEPKVLLALGGTLLIAALMARRVRGAILIGLLATAIAGLPLGLTKFEGVMSTPPSLSPTLFKMDVFGILKDPRMWEIVFVFLYLAVFDTVGTLVGVCQKAGLMVNGVLPRAKQAFLADASGAAVGAALGTSTITCYIESATGVASGGRTGLANVATAALFLLALFFKPLVAMIGVPHVIAPALIIVGALMLEGVGRVKWDDATEGIPAFLTLIVMPLTINITEGIAFGFISYSLLKLVSGRARDAHWLVHLCAALFILRYIFLRG